MLFLLYVLSTCQNANMHTMQVCPLNDSLKLQSLLSVMPFPVSLGSRLLEKTPPSFLCSLYIVVYCMVYSPFSTIHFLHFISFMDPLMTLSVCSPACAASYAFAYMSFLFDHCMIILADVFVFPPEQPNFPPMLEEGKFVIVV